MQWMILLAEFVVNLPVPYFGMVMVILAVTVYLGVAVLGAFFLSTDGKILTIQRVRLPMSVILRIVDGTPQKNGRFTIPGNLGKSIFSQNRRHS